VIDILCAGRLWPLPCWLLPWAHPGGIIVVTIPIVMPLAFALRADIPPTIDALLSASAFTNQACFYSDSAELAGPGRVATWSAMA